MAKGIRAPSRHRVNVWVAYLMPVLIIGMVGYATYVYVALVCINHLLLAQRREPAAIVLLTLYFVFFLLLGSSYFRVVWTINANPGFVERGPQQSLYGGNEQALKEKNHSDGFDDSGSGSDLEIGLGGMRGGDAQVEEGMSLAPSSKPATATSLHNPDTASLSEALRNIPPTQDGLPAPLSPPHATENLPFSSNHSTFVHNVPDPSIAEHFHFPPPQPGNAPVQGFPYGNYEMPLCAKVMGFQNGVVIATAGNPIVPTIARKWDVACGVWIIFAPGLEVLLQKPPISSSIKLWFMERCIAFS
ncbi:Palmitoyltransferase pfa5 [Rhizina undulata]